MLPIMIIVVVLPLRLGFFGVIDHAEETKTPIGRKTMQINVSLDGQALFSWKGDAAAVANIDEKMTRVADSGNVTQQQLWQSTLVLIKDNVEFFSSNRETGMMVVLWGLMSSPTRDPDRPGVFRDYVGTWDYANFDIKIDDRRKRFTIVGEGGYFIKGEA